MKAWWKDPMMGLRLKYTSFNKNQPLGQKSAWCWLNTQMLINQNRPGPKSLIKTKKVRFFFLYIECLVN